MKNVSEERKAEVDQLVNEIKESRHFGSLEESPEDDRDEEDKFSAVARPVATGVVAAQPAAEEVEASSADAGNAAEALRKRRGAVFRSATGEAAADEEVQEPLEEQKPAEEPTTEKPAVEEPGAEKTAEEQQLFDEGSWAEEHAQLQSQLQSQLKESLGQMKAPEESWYQTEGWNQDAAWDSSQGVWDQSQSWNEAQNWDQQTWAQEGDSAMHWQQAAAEGDAAMQWQQAATEMPPCTPEVQAWVTAEKVLETLKPGEENPKGAKFAAKGAAEAPAATVLRADAPEFNYNAAAPEEGMAGDAVPSPPSASPENVQDLKAEFEGLYKGLAARGSPLTVHMHTLHANENYHKLLLTEVEEADLSLAPWEEEEAPETALPMDLLAKLTADVAATREAVEMAFGGIVAADPNSSDGTAEVEAVKMESRAATVAEVPSEPINPWESMTSAQEEGDGSGAAAEAKHEDSCDWWKQDSWHDDQQSGGQNWSSHGKSWAETTAGHAAEEHSWDAWEQSKSSGWHDDSSKQEESQGTVSWDDLDWKAQQALSSLPKEEMDKLWSQLMQKAAQLTNPSAWVDKAARKRAKELQDEQWQSGWQDTGKDDGWDTSKDDQWNESSWKEEEEGAAWTSTEKDDDDWNSRSWQKEEKGAAWKSKKDEDDWNSHSWKEAESDWKSAKTADEAWKGHSWKTPKESWQEEEPKASNLWASYKKTPKETKVGGSWGGSDGWEKSSSSWEGVYVDTWATEKDNRRKVEFRGGKLHVSSLEGTFSETGTVSGNRVSLWGLNGIVDDRSIRWDNGCDWTKEDTHTASQWSNDSRPQRGGSGGSSWSGGDWGAKQPGSQGARHQADPDDDEVNPWESISSDVQPQSESKSGEEDPLYTNDPWGKQPQGGSHWRPSLR
eukprot:gb/GFBE01009198.1/.p1 GENE.gb/GFBE01009198.1/~~gb/GFBE01009198.1/.p1  ORF type:complete len:894 (+),score=227.65 gb/GFBE01009198.1/:1-2682(+)